MKRSIFIKLLILIVLVSVSSCYHKNIAKCEADDVVKIFVFTKDKVNYLISVENIFQATSKSSNGGFTQISGYNQQRISLYDLNTGKVVNRVDLGKINYKKPYIVLGCSESNIWIYSLNKNKGLYSLDPITLKEKVNQEQIFVYNSNLKGNLAVPTYTQIQDFYFFDELTNRLIVTDNQGYRHSISSKSLLSEKIDDNEKFYRVSSTYYLSASSEFKNKSVFLKGDIRKVIEFDNKVMFNNISFIDGKFINDCNRNRIFANCVRLNKKLETEYNKIVQTIDSLNKNKTSANNNSFTKRYVYYNQDTITLNINLGDFSIKINDKPYQIENKLNNLKYTYESKMREINYDIDRLKNGSIPSNYLLQSDTNSFYIAHKNSTNNDAYLTISKVKINESNNIEVLWTTTIDNVFYDYSQASQTDAFKKVFSKGNPDFNFEYYDIVDDKLLIVHILNMICIDCQTGKILWQFRI